MAGAEQRIVGDPISGETYRLSVYKSTVRLDFNPHDKDLILYPSEPNTGQSQVWSLVEHQTDVWLIKSSYGGYLKNNGSGKPVTIHKTKNDGDLTDKKLQWLLSPAF